MAVKGIFVSDAGTIGERERELNYALLRYSQPGSAPLFTLSAGMRQEQIRATTVEWYEESCMQSQVRVIDNHGNAMGNLFTLEDASFIHSKMMIQYDETGEYLYVLAVNGNQITVKRGYGQSAALPINVGGAGSYFTLIATAFEEGSHAPTPLATTSVPRRNVTQIFRRSWGLTETARAIAYNIEDRLARNTREAMNRIANDVEMAYWWGIRDTGVIDGNPFRSFNGILNQIQTNIFVAPAGGMPERTLDEYIERTFAVGIEGAAANERLFFAGNTAIQALNQLAKSGSTFMVGENQQIWGFNINTYRCPFGDMKVIAHPLMNKSAARSGSIYAIHPAAIVGHTLRPIDEQASMKGSANMLVDSSTGVYTGELSISYQLEQTGSILTGIEPIWA